MTVDLTECRAKIERAQEHRKGLDAVVGPVLDGEAEIFHIDAKLDPQSGYHIFRLATMPEDWRLQVGVILGDAVHNLRSALEYLFFALCSHYLGVQKTERLGKQVQFPMEDDRNAFVNKRMHFNKIPLSQWAVIDRAQPYHGAHHPCRAIKALRDLSNRDKHRVLNPPLLTTTAITFDTDKIPMSRATGGLRVPRPPKRLEIGTEVVRVPFSPDVDAEVEMAGHVSPDVRLPELDTGIIRGVDMMIHAVKLIVGDIRAEL
jgi:hypothetical protein